MFAQKIKRAISLVLSLLLLFQGSLPYSQVFAQEATESATPILVEPTPEITPTPTLQPTPEPLAPTEAPQSEVGTPTPTPTPIPEWQTLDGAEVTIQPVSEGHTYRYKDTPVSVIFTKITQPGLLKIKEVAVGDATGYDITSDMPDGTFVYDLTLPNPNPSQEAKVQYSEDGQTYQNLSSEKQNDVFIIKGLDHFTIFVVRSDTPTNDGTSTTNDASGGSVCIADIGSNICYQTIQAAIDAASPGDTINIADGTYSDPVTIDKSDLIISCQSNNDTIINTGDANIGISLLSGADNVTIQNCNITGNGDGINLNSVSGVTIQNNTISNNTYATSGVHIQDSTGVVITNNSFSGNDTDISNDSSADVNAQNNDWGTFDGSVINDRIYDHLDDGSLGLVQYDADPPTVDAGSDVTTNTSFDRTGTASDTYGIARVEWSEDSGEVIFEDSSAYTTNISANSDDEYTITFTAWDNQGNFNSDEFTLIWDTSNPTDPTPISTSHTVETWSMDRTIDVTWSDATDDLSGVDGYYTEWNRLVDSLLNVATKEYEEDASSETSPNRSTAQDHYFHIATLDNAGNWTSTAHLGPFWIDAANPTGSWITPTGGVYLSGTVNLEVSASDVGSGVQRVTFRIRPTGGTYSNISVDTTSPYQATLDTTTKPDGTYDLRGLIRDNSGRNNAGTNAVIAVTIDNTPPQTSIDSFPASLVATSSADFTFSADETATFECQLDSAGFSACTSPLTYSWLADGSHTFEVRAIDQAGNTDPTPASYTWTVDTTPPTVSWITPTSGSVISGSTLLEVSISETATTEFLYQRQDGIDTFHPITSPWDTSTLPLDNYTLRVIATDTAGNSTTVDETIQVAAVISGQNGSTPSFGQITISWTTDRPTSGRVVYDTVSHTVLGAAPNYGYAFSTDTIDSSPKSTSHTITITGLSDNTSYYWRTVSAGSPTAIGPEYSSRTFSLPGASNSGGGGGGGGVPAPVVAGVATALPLLSFAPEVEFTPEETLLPSPTPATVTDTATPVPQVKGAATFNWWYFIIPAALLGLIISGLLLYRRP